jgi:hypothetical protein
MTMPIKMKTTGTIGLAIMEYMGIELGQIKSLQCSPDPVVEGTYAFRATVEEANCETDVRNFDFLTIGVALNRVKADDLEECDWATWPPVSAGRVTGWVVR